MRHRVRQTCGEDHEMDWLMKMGRFWYASSPSGLAQTASLRQAGAARNHPDRLGGALFALFSSGAVLLAPFQDLAGESHAAATLPELQLQLSNHLSHEKFASALWGVKIVSLDTDKVLFEHNARKLFSPASNSKLYTVALGLDRLGPDYRIKTSLYSAAPP